MAYSKDKRIFKKNMDEGRTIIASLRDSLIISQLTQDELADDLGVSFVTISKWFNGHAIPNRGSQKHILTWIEQHKVS